MSSQFVWDFGGIGIATIKYQRKFAELTMTEQIGDNPLAARETITFEGAATRSLEDSASKTVTGDRIPWVGEITQPAIAVMAVIDSKGNLVPLHTAGDLLRVFKTIWHATED